MNKLRVLILIVLLLPSCTTLIFINQTLPPEIELQEKDQKMVIQNFFDYTRPEFVKEKHEEVYHSGVSSFTHGLVSFLEDSDLITALEGDTLVISGPGRFLSDVLDPDYVSETCNRFDADLLLSFDSLLIDFDWETETFENDDGSKSKTKYFYLQLESFLSLYDKTGKLIDRSSVPVEMEYSSRLALTGLITIKPSLKKARPDVISLADRAGHEYGEKFFQSTANIPYKIYHTKPFKTAYRLVQTRNWEEAIRELLPLASSSDSKIAKRAAFNLFVAYTALGDEASADSWFKRAK